MATTPQIGDIVCHDIRGYPGLPQKSVNSVYHADGIEQDATGVRGVPFTLMVLLLDTLSDTRAKYSALAELCGGETVTILLGNELEIPNCQLGTAEIGGGVRVVDQEDVIDMTDGVQKIYTTLTVSGHVLS